MLAYTINTDASTTRIRHQCEISERSELHPRYTVHVSPKHTALTPIPHVEANDMNKTGKRPLMRAGISCRYKNVICELQRNRTLACTRWCMRVACEYMIYISGADKCWLWMRMCGRWRRGVIECHVVLALLCTRVCLFCFFARLALATPVRVGATRHLRQLCRDGYERSIMPS